MKNEKGQKLGKRKQKSVLAKKLGLKLTLYEIDRLDLEMLKLEVEIEEK